MSTKMLNHRQARWAQTFAQFKFLNTYRPDPRNGKPNALTRRSDDPPKAGDEKLTQQYQTVLKSECFQLSSPASTTMGHDPTLFPCIRLALSLDLLSKQLMIVIAEKISSSRFLLIAECQVKDALLYYQSLHYISDNTTIKLAILRSCYDAISVGHLGRARTLELLSRYYCWHQMQMYTAR